MKPCINAIKSNIKPKFSQKNGFTTAEVLITLGIIGVVAALTIPILVENHKKQVVVTSLRKFYSTFYQAIKLAEIDNGNMADWVPPTKDHDAASLKIWWQEYMEPYLKKYRTDIKNNWFLVAFSDGSGAGIKSISSKSLNFMITYCVNYDVCLSKEFNVRPESGAASTTRNSFQFVMYNGKFYPNGSGESRDQLLNNLKYGCKIDTGVYAHRYCAALIEYDGWKISDDYPW